MVYCASYRFPRLLERMSWINFQDWKFYLGTYFMANDTLGGVGILSNYQEWIVRIRVALGRYLEATPFLGDLKAQG